MRRILFAVFFIIVVLGTHEANAKNQIDTARKFTLTFFDTSLALTPKLHLHYEEKDGNEAFSLSLSEDINSPKILEMSSLNYSEVEKALLAYGISEGMNGVITRFSVYEVFYWIFLEVYGEPKRPLAGRLDLATEVQYYIGSEGLGKGYLDRVRNSDGLIAKNKYVPVQLSILRSQIGITKDSMERLRKENKLLNDYLVDLGNQNRDEKEKNIITAQITAKIDDLKENDIKRAQRLKDNISKLKNLEKNNVSNFNNLKDSINGGFKTLETNGIFKNSDQNKLKNLKGIVESEDNVEVLDETISYMGSIIETLENEVKAKINKLLEINKNIIKEFNDKIISVADSEQLSERITALEMEYESLKPQIKENHISRVIRTDIQIERGFIENVKVILEIEGRETIFENSFAIGFTSKSNYRAFANTKLFARLGNASMHIYLSDVIRNYDNEIDLYTRDYSPADTLIKVDPSENPRVDVFKASIIDLLDVKFYTDLEGLANKQPNGLVQFEASRKLNINTVRKQIKNEFNWGFCNYLFIYGTLNKIENNLKYLPLRNQNVVANGKLASPSYATTLDFLQYRNITMGAELNIYLYDAPSLKSTFTADLGFQYGHTPVLDYMRTFDSADVFQGMGDSVKVDANMFTIYPRLGLELFPERRLGLSFGYQPQYTRIFTNNAYKQIQSYAKSDASLLPIEPVARFTHMFEMFVRLELNRETSSRLFFRGRFHWQHGDVNTYFPQLQLGYSHNLKIPKLER